MSGVAPGAMRSGDPFQRVLVSARHVALDEDPVPDRELHQPPDRTRGIPSPLLLAHQCRDALGPEPVPNHGMPYEMGPQLVEKRAPKPLADGHVEPALAAPQMLARQPTLAPTLQKYLALPGTDLERVRQGQAELHHPVIQKWHAAFETEGHHDPVDLDEQLIAEPRDEVDVLATGDVAPGGGGCL